MIQKRVWKGSVKEDLDCKQKCFLTSTEEVWNITRYYRLSGNKCVHNGNDKIIVPYQREFKRLQ